MNFKPIFRKEQFWFVLSILILILDLVTKAVTDGMFQEAIPGFFHIESHHNTGASFSIFSNSKVAQIIFIILGFVVSLFLIWYSFCSKNKHLNNLYYAGSGLMLSGIIGNLLDRLMFGYVRDFIALDFMNFAIFNVADSALCVGVFCVAIWLLFFAFKEEKGKEKNDGKKDF